MNDFLKVSGIAAGILAGVAVPASAALLDFTNLSGDGSPYATMDGAMATGSIDGIGWTLTPGGGQLSFNGGADAPGSVPPLAGEGDGIGVGNDEIGPGEWVTIAFDEAVHLTGVHLLDHFIAQSGQDMEIAGAFMGMTPTGPAQQIAAQMTIGDAPTFGTGYAFGETDLTGTSFSFALFGGNDDLGVGDFALAGLEVAAVPVPAAGLMLVAALGGLGWARRRKA